MPSLASAKAENSNMHATTHTKIGAFPPLSRGGQRAECNCGGVCRNSRGSGHWPPCRGWPAHQPNLVSELRPIRSAILRCIQYLGLEGGRAGADCRQRGYRRLTRQLRVAALGHGLKGAERVRAEDLDEEVQARPVVERADLMSVRRLPAFSESGERRRAPRWSPGHLLV